MGRKTLQEEQEYLKELQETLIKHRAMFIALVTCLANKDILNWRDIETIKHTDSDEDISEQEDK